MSDVTFSCKAYAKIVMHAVKYPHCALNGVLLADNDKIKEGSKIQKITIVDAIPLFHQCLHLTPMAEVALTQIDGMCAAAGLMVVGYYAATDNFSHNTLDKAPAIKIAEKIADIFPSALFVMVDNRKLSLQNKNHVLKVAQHSDGKWKSKDSSNIKVDEETLSCTQTLVTYGTYKNLIDYDNHLDDISQDWTNSCINSQIDEIMKLEQDHNN